MNDLGSDSRNVPFIFRKLCTLKPGPDGALQVNALGLKFPESKVQNNRNSLKRVSLIMIALSIALIAIGVIGGLSVIALIYEATVVSLLWFWTAVFLAAFFEGRA